MHYRHCRQPVVSALRLSEQHWAADNGHLAGMEADLVECKRNGGSEDAFYCRPSGDGDERLRGGGRIFYYIPIIQFHIVHTMYSMLMCRGCLMCGAINA